MRSVICTIADRNNIDVICLQETIRAEIVTAQPDGGMKMPSTGHIRDRDVATHQVLRSFVMKGSYTPLTRVCTSFAPAGQANEGWHG